MPTEDNSQATSPAPAPVPAPAPAPAPADNSQAQPSPVPQAAPSAAPTVAATLAADGSTPGPSSPPSTPPQDAGRRREGWDLATEELDFDVYNKLMDGLRTLPEEALRNDAFVGSSSSTAAPSSNPAPAPAPAPATPTSAAAPASPAPAPAQDDGSGLPHPGQSPHQQIRFRPQDSVDETALRLAKEAGKPVTSLEIINAARALNGLPPVPDPSAPPASPAPAPEGTGSATGTPPPAAPTDGKPTTLAEADARIEQLRAQRRDARENFDFDREDELERQIEQLQETRVSLRDQAALQQQQADAQREQQFAQDWQRHNELALARYPAIADPNSPLLARAKELQTAAGLRGDPMFHDPRSALWFVQEAAAESGIAPVLTPAPQPAAPPAAPAPTPQPTPSVATSQPSGVPPLSAMISGGSSGASAPPAATERQLVEEVTSSPEAYQRYLASLSGIKYGSG